MKKAIIILVAILFSANANANPAPDYNLDFFTGSIEMKGKDMILRRCDAAENSYILRPSPRAKANYLNKLRAKKLPPKNTTTLIAHYVEINGKDGLEIFNISEIKRDKSCHLSELLDETFRE